MKKAALLLLALACLNTRAQVLPVPAPDRLLPADTLGVFTIPDMATARRLFDQSPQMQFWRDPAMKPFVDRFWSKFESGVLKPFETELGTSVADLLDLAQGQVTLAVTRNGWPAEAGSRPGLLLLIDARKQANRLPDLLERARARAGAGGQPVKTERIGGAEFIVLTVAKPAAKTVKTDAGNPDGADQANPPGGDGAKPETQELFVGQSGSMLVCGSSRMALEQTLRLKKGDAVMALGDSSVFLPDYNSTLRDATAYGWINLEPLLDVVRETLPGAGGGLPMGLSPSRILTAVGLMGLKTLSFGGTLRSDGAYSEVRLRVPETDRRGLFRVLSFEAKDASPGAFVPPDALAFSRTRMDLKNAWNALESMVVEVSPQLGGMLRMTVDAIGKDKDSSFDFRKKFVANLGDDLITWQMAPKAGAPLLVGGPPQMALISSPDPEELAASLKLLMGMVPADVAKLEESTVGGVKVWSMAIPMGLPAANGTPPPTQTIAFAAANGYLAVASSGELLKNYLESRPATGGSLLDRSGLRVAAGKVGGLETGMFGFTDDRENVRSYWTALTTPDSAGSNPTALMLHQLMTASAAAGDGKGLADWVDISLLPSFDKVEKYFGYSVFSGAAGGEAFTFKYFAPKPSGL